MLKDKKQRPATGKQNIKSTAAPAVLKTNQIQDEGVNLHKILSFYRDKVDAHEKDRYMYIHKMD